MLLLTLAFASFQSTRLQVGTNWSGTEVLHYFSKESEIDETHRFKLAFRITGQDERMWVVERRGTLLGSKMGETEMPPPPYNEPTVSKVWLSPAGFLLDAEPFDRGTFDLDRLLAFWMHANNPDDWNVDLSTPITHSVAKGRAEFKLVSKPSGPSRNYGFTYTSNQISAKGTMWFDVASGRIIQAKLEATNALLPGGRDRVNVSISYKGI